MFFIGVWRGCALNFALMGNLIGELILNKELRFTLFIATYLTNSNKGSAVSQRCMNLGYPIHLCGNCLHSYKQIFHHSVSNEGNTDIQKQFANY